MRFHILILCAVLGASATSDARAMKSWSYAEMVEKSDIVVIASVGKTTLTVSNEAIPNMGITGTRIATEATIVATLKGKPPKAITLHLIAMKGSAMPANGPNLIVFDSRPGVQYLMFLVKDKDGEYVPVTGQTDPVFSIEPLRARP